MTAQSDAPLTDAERIDRLERQVDVLRRALGLMTVSAQPTVQWLDASFDAIAKGKPSVHDRIITRTDYGRRMR